MLAYAVGSLLLPFPTPNACWIRHHLPILKAEGIRAGTAILSPATIYYNAFICAIDKGNIRNNAKQNHACVFLSNPWCISDRGFR
uniref:Uncharacterized protein n=1 Tax=Salix viminalis TaxID=40686 RepID=A0A6N2KGJ2_SALVM